MDILYGGLDKEGVAVGEAIVTVSAFIIYNNMENVVVDEIQEVEDEYQLIYKEKNDILNELDFENEEERILCDSIISNLEKTAAEAIKSMQVAQLPFIGCVRIDPIKRQLRDAKLHLSAVRKSLTKEQYKEHVRTFIIDLKEKQKRKDKLKLLFSRIRSNNKSKYEYLYKKCGRAYAELFIMSIYWLKEIPYDDEWEYQYQLLSGRIKIEDYE